MAMVGTACGGTQGSGGAAGNAAATQGSSGGAGANGAEAGAGDAGAGGWAGPDAGRAGPDAGRAADAGARGDGATEFNVTGDPQQTGFDVTGSSDLPAAPPNTMQPYAQIIESTLSPARAALGECFRPLGPPWRRSYRLTVETNGQIVPRPPQPAPLPQDVNQCVEGILRGFTLSPAPPRETPYDLSITVSQ